MFFFLNRTLSFNLYYVVLTIFLLPLLRSINQITACQLETVINLHRKENSLDLIWLKIMNCQHDLNPRLVHAFLVLQQKNK